MITINEIAKRAGVAKSTVSRYLNNGSVSEKTKNKIAEIIEETGYQPNLYAQSLKAQKSNMIGVIIPRLNSASTNEALAGIDFLSKELGYEPVILNSNLIAKNDLKNIHILNNQKVDGIIFFAGELTPEIIEAIKESAAPVVLIGQELEGIDSITHEDYNAGYMMGAYVGQEGHRKALFFGVTENDQAVGIRRKKGFVDGFAGYGGDTLFFETSFSKSKTYTLAKAALPKYFEEGITLIGCATDNIAIAVLKALHDLGKRVPEDYSIFGFGGYDITNYVNPTITTIRYPYYEIGKEAVNHLLRIVEKKKLKPQAISLPNELIIQDSVKKV